MKKRGLLLLMAAALAVTLVVGCASQKFDASGYMNATLQYMKTGSTADRDALAKYTGQSADEVQAEYDEIFGQIPEMMDTEMQAQGIVLDDEASEQMEAVIKAMFSSMSFTVGEATENDDGSFDVPVDIQPLQLSLDIEQIQSDYLENLDYSQYVGMAEEDISNAVVNDVLKLLFTEINAQLDDEPTYGEAVTYTVHIAPDEDGVYTPDEADMEQLGNGIVQGLADALA